jgi:hypothetical protein
MIQSYRPLIQKLTFTWLMLLTAQIGLKAQTGSISGVVTDSLTGQPVANLSVFIPFTTIGTTTDQNGWYKLDPVSPGYCQLIFRHLSYKPIAKDFILNPGENIRFNLSVPQQPIEIPEVHIVGKPSDLMVSKEIFMKFFIGDPFSRVCKLLNQKGVDYSREANSIRAVAHEPLEIDNEYLGYRLTWYLDYFRYEETVPQVYSWGQNGRFGFAGSALYQDLADNHPIRAALWNMKRKSEFKGSLKHFLACLYRDKLASNLYHIRKAYKGLPDLQVREKETLALAKVNFARMDSLFNWDPLTGNSEYLYYYPKDEYDPAVRQTVAGKEKEWQAPSVQTVYVFYDYRRTKDLRDDAIFLLTIRKGSVFFDRNGNYRIKTDGLTWTYLDNSVQVKNALPLDYMPKIK